MVYAQLPGFFNQREAALADLTWCVENADKAPHAGWLREVYYQLATLYRSDGRTAQAQEYLRLSGYADFEKPITLTTPFAEDLAAGHTFSPKRIAEIVPGKVYALSGYEFTEYYFVVSDDGRELIGIDAGTRPDSAQAAYEALRAYAPRLPELTAVLITHAHWDHVGGHKYFRSLNPRLKFYARENYHERAFDRAQRSRSFRPALLRQPVQSGGCPEFQTRYHDRPSDRDEDRGNANRIHPSAGGRNPRCAFHPSSRSRRDVRR